MLAGGNAFADTTYGESLLNSNARSLGAVLDAYSGESDAVVGLLGSLSELLSVEDATALLRAVNPGAAYAGMASASLQRSLAVTAALDAHLENLAAAGGSDSAVSFGVGQVKNSPSMLTPSGNKMEHKSSDWTSWASGFVTRGTTDADEENGIGKAKNRDRGGSVGVETKIGNLRVGGMFAAGKAEAKFDDIVTVDTDHWHAGAYGSVALGSVTVDASAIYGSADNKSRRNDGLDDLEGKFSSRDFQAGVGVAVNVLPAESHWEVTPIARVKYINYSQEAFEETSLNGTGVPVSVDKIKEDKFISKVGLRLGYKAEVSRSVTLSTDGGAYWVHDYKTDGKAANLQLAGVNGSNFSADGLKQEADTASFNLGVQATFADEVTLRVSAQHDMGSHSKQSTGLVSVGVSF